MTLITAAANGDWNTGATWVGGVAPAATNSVEIPTGITVSTINTDTSGGGFDQTGGTVTVDGTLALNDTGCGGASITFATLTIDVGAALSDGQPTNPALDTSVNDGDVLTVNGNLTLKGSIGVQAGYIASGEAPPGSIEVGGILKIYNGAEFINYNPLMMQISAFQCYAAGVAHVFFPTTWTIRQYVDFPPNPVTILSTELWTDVAIDGNLGGITLLTTDYAGSLLDPLQPPHAVVYRNGALWNGVISVTCATAGQYSFDMSFADGIWQLGDHGSISIYWSQLEADEVTVQWFCRIYYWLVNRLNYETWQRVTTALPNAAPGTAGGLPLLDDHNQVPADLEGVKGTPLYNEPSAGEMAYRLSNSLGGEAPTGTYMMVSDPQQDLLSPEIPAGTAAFATAFPNAPTSIVPPGDVTAIQSGLATAMWSNTQRTLTGTGGAIGPTAGINSAPIPFRLLPHQSPLLSAQVCNNGHYATIEGTASIVYTIWDCEKREAVPGHKNVSLTPSAVLFDTLQTDAAASSYNFRWQPNLALGDAFAHEGRYMIALTFTPVSGLPFWANFEGRSEW